MKHLLLSISILTLASCGDINRDSQGSGSRTVDLSENLISSCSVARDEESSEVVISCPDGTQEVIQDGKDGSSCTVEALAGGSMIACGETQAFIKDGTDGLDGSACSVALDAAGLGSLISCSDGTSAFIRNGLDGQDGANGEDGQDGAKGEDGQDGAKGRDGLDAVLEVIDPCGSETTQGFDEVLLVLSSGDILAHLSDGDNQHFVVVQRNRKYITSDGTQCSFEVTADGEIKY